MQRAKAFGRRVPPKPAAVKSPARIVRAGALAEPIVETPIALPETRPATASGASSIDELGPCPKTVEQELEEWKETRKIKKRSFREPWRTVSIVAGIALAPTSFLAPPEVVTIADLALGVLSIGSLYAGWRGKKKQLGKSS